MNPKIKKALKDPYYACELVLNQLARYFSDEIFVKWKYYLNFRKKLRLEDPQTFNEKLQWLKLNDQHEEYTQMVDKYEAKKYVASIIGEEFIIPTIGIYNSFEEIDLTSLPQQFVLKCTHNSGGIVICKDKKSFEKAKAKRFLTKYLHKNPFWSNREYPYKNVKPRIIVEQFMVNSDDKELKDYKFYCFHGRAEFCQVIANRNTNETIDFYDRNWVHQEFIGLNPDASFAKEVEKMPFNYYEMVNIADELSQMINSVFVRIDLYNINEKIFFGEITFFPNSGIGSFKPQKWNLLLGNMIHLPT